MGVLEILADPGMLPFEVAFGIVAGLLVLEIVLNQLGISAFGSSDTDTDLDLDTDFDAETGFDIDAEADLDLDAGGDVDADVESGSPGGLGGLLSWLGLGAVPTTIWLASLLVAFALLGYGLQLGATNVLGRPLGPWLASGIAALPALLAGGRLARLIGRIIPSEQTTAISTRSYGRRRGVITVGTARADKPAQVRFTDSHGNMHYAMVTPLDPKDSFPQGTEVLILRIPGGALKAVALSD